MEKIQEILNKGWKSYIKNHKVIGYKKKAITAIADCKTGAIGAHKYVCDECGYEEIAYNSCRNRHCPNCQAGKKLQWIEARNIKIEDINSMVGFNNKVNNIILGGEANDYAYPKSDGSGWIVKGQDSNYQMWNFQEIESYSIANDNGTYLWFNNNRME